MDSSRSYFPQTLTERNWYFTLYSFRMEMLPIIMLLSHIVPILVSYSLISFPTNQLHLILLYLGTQDVNYIIPT